MDVFAMKEGYIKKGYMLQSFLKVIDGKIFGICEVAQTNGDSKNPKYTKLWPFVGNNEIEAIKMADKFLKEKGI